MKIKFLTVYRTLNKSNKDPEFGVFWSEYGWESSDWTKTHLRGTYVEISKYVEERLPFRLPTKEKLKKIEENGDQVVFNSGSGIVYINIIEDGKFISING